MLVKEGGGKGRTERLGLIYVKRTKLKRKKKKTEERDDSKKEKRMERKRQRDSK